VVVGVVGVYAGGVYAVVVVVGGGKRLP